MNEVFNGKIVLITGGTGFIGRSLTEDILQQDPDSIRIYSRDEFKHHKMRESVNDPRVRHLVGDVRDFSRLSRAMKDVDIVIHAAAMKRIDMIEYNVNEAIKTNVFGTLNVVESCLENDVEKAVYISTDKACSPINTYGATKLLGERIFVESNFNKGRSNTKFLVVRYGNVLESTGSVIPFFMEKIKKSQTIPLTDERMTRFIISSRRAIDLIKDALTNGVGGEIFIPKIKSMRIVDLIDVMKEFYGCGNQVKIIGIRPGEKIHEVLINDDESTRSYELGDSYIILSQIDKYQSHIKYQYLNGKIPVGFREMKSSDFLLVKDKLKEMLITEGILN